ncbi:cupin domain-containing protein [Winogradskyella sediminis]|uniref:Mannose-6-phosphate isomerase, cupin superfamily n=1 Tax=Winogradskyella sediminis TaxID=1382466 RepID=A0A1H1UR34_9FLAO|nr:cupin domain-containing protein [Winogradskyella sediminis]SDS74955.1 Mannose-6-phosphate isomerase, cupin superfamily [Winogradskyella sediminis]
MKKNKKYTIQNSPFVVPTEDGKIIKEHFGNATDGNSNISIAHMVAPAGWSEPFQTPEFDEYTFIIKGKKQFIIDGDTIVLEAGQSIKVEKNTRLQYSNPFTEPCEYLAICLPAFSIEAVNREEE